MESSKYEYINWNSINSKVREYVFGDENFANQSFCSGGGKIFVNRDLVDKYCDLLAYHGGKA